MDGLARRLATAVQARAKPAASAGVRAARVLARKPGKVKTSGGTFDAVQYDVLQPEEPSDHVGAQISLEFRPEAPVEGRVGLIQTISHGKGAWIDAPKTMLAKPKQRDVEWQKYVVGQSPVFGALRDPTKAPSDQPLTLADTTQPSEVIDMWETGAHEGALSKEAEAAHKESYKSRRGRAKIELVGRIQTGARHGEDVTPASLTDRPGFAADQKHAREPVVWTAETAAVVLDGPWAGTYLGSVRWGWRSEPREGGLPKVTLDPETIELVSAFVPSQEFLVAGLAWNKTLTLEDAFGTHAVVPVPVPSVYPFERWNLADKGEGELLAVKRWLLNNWEKLTASRQLQLVAWRLVAALKQKGIIAERKELATRLESLAAIEQRGEKLVA